MKYIQIDGTAFLNAKISLLMSRCGAVAFTVFCYVLLRMAEAEDSENCAIAIDERFIEAAAFILRLPKDEVHTALCQMIDLDLLISSEAGYWSAGFMKRTGRLMEQNRRRSETQKANIQKKQADADAKRKPKAKPEPDQKTETEPASPAVAKVMELIARDFAGLEGQAVVKLNGSSNLTNPQIQRLLDKYGLLWLGCAIPIFYGWKRRTPKVVKSDNLSFDAEWLKKEVALHLPEYEKTPEGRKLAEELRSVPKIMTEAELQLQKILKKGVTNG